MLPSDATRLQRTSRSMEKMVTTCSRWWKGTYTTHLVPFSTGESSASAPRHLQKEWCRRTQGLMQPHCLRCGMPTMHYLPRIHRRVCPGCTFPGEHLHVSVAVCHLFAGRPVTTVTTFTELQLAVRAAHPADTIVVAKSMMFLCALNLEVPVRIQGADGTTPHIVAAGRFPLFVANAPVSMENLAITGYEPYPRSRHAANPYGHAMCAMELRSAVHLRGCIMQSYGTCVLLARIDASLTEPTGVVITECTFHDSLCAGICITSHDAPACFRVRGNHFLRNGWGFQDDGNAWGTLEEVFPGWTALNTFDGNQYLRLVP
jgi:hypothetical protein